MGKSPAFQFYPADWLNDIKLQSCSLQAQGLLVNLICLMHQANPYGYLIINNLVPDDKTVAKLLRLHHKTYDKTLKELFLYGVLKRDKNGIIYCERMVKDEAKRQYCREAGTKGGSPNLGVEYNKPGFVYYIKNNVGLIKIGISASPEKRLYRLKQRFEDDNMLMIEKKWVDDMGKMENLLHEYYKEYNINGEWFKIPEKALFALSVLLKVNNKVSPPPSSSSSSKEYKSDSIEYRLANYLYKFILKRNPNYKKPNIQKWSKQIDLMIRIDKRKPDDIKKVIEWCQADTPDKQTEGTWKGWANNILSTAKLREKFDKLFLKMKEQEENQEEPENFQPSLKEQLS